MRAYVDGFEQLTYGTSAAWTARAVPALPIGDIHCTEDGADVTRCGLPLSGLSRLPGTWERALHAPLPKCTICLRG